MNIGVTELGFAADTPGDVDQRVIFTGVTC
jgi:hypothetical protein